MQCLIRGGNGHSHRHRRWHLRSTCHCCMSSRMRTAAQWPHTIRRQLHCTALVAKAAQMAGCTPRPPLQCCCALQRCGSTAALWCTATLTEGRQALSGDGAPRRRRWRSREARSTARQSSWWCRRGSTCRRQEWGSENPQHSAKLVSAGSKKQQVTRPRLWKPNPDTFLHHHVQSHQGRRPKLPM